MHGVRLILEHLDKHRAFYRTALMDTSKNSFGEYFEDLLYAIIWMNISKVIINELGAYNTSRFIRLNAELTRISVLTWLNNDKETLEQFMLYTYASLQAVKHIAELLEKLGEDQPSPFMEEQQLNTDDEMQRILNERDKLLTLPTFCRVNTN
jgi:hypothetical protein